MPSVKTAYRIYRNHGLSVLFSKLTTFLKQKSEALIGLIYSWFFSVGLVDRISYVVSTARLQDRMQTETDLSDVLDTAYNYSGFGFYDDISPIQHPDEIERVVRIIE